MHINLSFLKCCFPFFNQPYYSLLKKDDDLPIQQAQALINSFPIDERIKDLTQEKAKRYAKSILANLNKTPIVPSTEPAISCHLIQICRLNRRVRQYVLDHLSLNGDKESIDRLKVHLILS